MKTQLRQFDPVATWQVQRFDGLPYLNTETPDGHFKIPHFWPPKIPQAGLAKL